MKRQVTIKDIAEKLGISPSTVSRSLKDHPDISEKTRNAVKELAKLLGYKPNLIALNLKNSCTNTIGLIVPEIEHHFFSKIISGIEDVAYEHNYNVLVVQSNESYMREVLNSQTLLSNRVDGLLVSFSKETKDFSHFQQIIDNEIPIVFYDRAINNLKADMVVVDDYTGAYDAVNHLISKGCRRVAFYSAPQHLVLGKDRLQGYIDALENNGIIYDKNLVYSCDSYDSAIKISNSVLKKVDKPDGVFAVNDLTALGVMKVAKKLGISIPEELKIVGFENSRNSVLTEPELSSVDQFGYILGKKAASILLERMKDETANYEPVKHVIKTKLIVRGSS
ncbi:MAG: LacI family DNA-binding transcriptional regulator [Bacteroidales bacterium]|jgi:DNA-binding LacI/PurR family transcriptional regulator|nr:LacI family DNA-binding transcriptional regulator [Bacteroidales bacterium]MDG1902703.1 LacI family DNA-binding transcriptional regulator [Bacteroidales bacterium]MDG2080565.1 LacI family DNA-binding transcriptional regulator [Bacteroidales bacterium]|tara:strand:- start:111 stop:1118 length:1008 start_codon:yes stop_codon:yes gene_type:complete